MKHVNLPSVLVIGGCLALALPAAAQQTQEDPAVMPGQETQQQETMQQETMQQEGLQAEPAPMGMDEQSIRELQQALNDAGYNVMVDGIWGQQTRTALEEFQQQEGIEPTGEPDQQTLSALQLDHLDTGMQPGMGAETQPGLEQQPGALEEDPTLEQDGEQPATQQ
jgi:hypothetical protein